MSEKVSSYNPYQIILHWLIAALIIANYFISDHMKRFFDAHLANNNSPANWVENFHIYAGLTILSLVVIRTIVRLLSRKTEKISTGNAFLDKISHYSHELLYVLMFLVPAFGAIAWFFDVDELGYIHVITMDCMMALVLVHAAAALFHHYILEDKLLLRMLGRS